MGDTVLNTPLKRFLIISIIFYACFETLSLLIVQSLTAKVLHITREYYLSYSVNNSPLKRFFTPMPNATSTLDRSTTEVNPLRPYLTKWSDTPKQFVGMKV